VLDAARSRFTPLRGQAVANTPNRWTSVVQLPGPAAANACVVEDATFTCTVNADRMMQTLRSCFAAARTQERAGNMLYLALGGTTAELSWDTRTFTVFAPLSALLSTPAGQAPASAATAPPAQVPRAPASAPKRETGTGAVTGGGAR
jgi:hypothetical protein